MHYYNARHALQLRTAPSRQATLSASDLLRKSSSSTRSLMYTRGTPSDAVTCARGATTAGCDASVSRGCYHLLYTLRVNGMVQ